MQHYDLNFYEQQTKEGRVIRIPSNVTLDQPIVLKHWQDGSSQAACLRYRIIAEPGSKATLLETFEGKEDIPYSTNIVTELTVGKNAVITYIKIQSEGKNASHLSQFTAHQEENSELNSHVLNLGGQLARDDIAVHLTQEKARCVLNGIYLPKETGQMEHTTLIHHVAPHCSSMQDYKGILQDYSHATFNGTIKVARNAILSTATQQNKNLLLSPFAQINTKPQLEILTNEISCAHGATVGKLDEDTLFYMLSRGIEKSDAIFQLILAFLHSNLSLIPSLPTRERIVELICQQLRRQP